MARELVHFSLWAVLLALVSLLTPQVARAQNVTSYVRGDDGAIGSAQACTAAPLVRTFNVADNFTVSDVDIGVYVTHTWRGDLRITLQSPNGTRVQLTNGDVNNLSGDNFNVLLNDEGTQLVNIDGNVRDHAEVEPPPFENDFIPNSPLSAFDGENSNGLWRMEICDLFPTADDGTFRYAELFLTSPPANSADLSLVKSVSTSSPAFGSTISFTLSLANAGPAAATNVEVLDQLPTGFDYVSSNGFGTFNPATGVWSVSTVASGQTRALTITGTVSAPTGVTITNFAEVIASDVADPDSTPGNSSGDEDDDASVSFTLQGTRTAGVPPVLFCPAGATTFDWDAASVVWQAGVLNQSFNLTGFGDVGFAVSSDGVFENDATFGGQSPAESNANSGGLAIAESSLHQFLDFSNRQQTATTVITLPNAVAGAQFTIFDVDFAANDFADQVTVTGTYQGATVIPVLTNGTANYVVGNTAIGDATSGNGSGAANVVVTFDQAIDSITIVYGNAPTAPIVPDGQAVTIHDIDFCTPQTQLSVTKISSIISDPVNPDSASAKAIPGSLVEYVIQVANTGISSTDPDTVIVTDTNPADIKLCRLTRTGGPVAFNDPGADTGLSYSFANLGSGTDSLEFSNDNGASFNYIPVDDGEGCDANVTGFRIRPSGAMAGGSGFTLRVRYEVVD